MGVHCDTEAVGLQCVVSAVLFLSVRQTNQSTQPHLNPPTCSQLTAQRSCSPLQTVTAQEGGSCASSTCERPENPDGVLCCLVASLHSPGTGGRFSGMRISWFDLWLVAPTWHSLSLFVVLTMVLTALGCSRPARGLDEWASELPSGGAHAWSVTNHHSAAAVVQLHSHRAHCSPIRNLQDR